MLSASTIREKFVQFFQDKAHTFVPSAPLVPINDPTLLFVNAGMNQFKNIFLGTEQSSFKRAANYQKCLRVSGKHNDLEDVGQDTYHHTFFEMLGNWSFGDYYKKESIAWAWELFTEVFALPKEKLYATYHHSDPESAELWKSTTDIKPEHVMEFGDKENFWEMGESGPCGPCSEIHIDLGPKACDKGHVSGHICRVNGDCGRYIELWNLVFIQYNKTEAGVLENLKDKHVDTGAGLERLVCVLQGKTSNYDTDLFQPLIQKIAGWSGKEYDGESAIAMRVISDHIRTLTFALSDGIIPSNEGRGYVIRRILRRAYRYGKKIGFNEPFLYKLVPTVLDIMGDAYPELSRAQKKVEKLIRIEEEKFAATLDKGLELFEKVLSTTKGKTFPGEEAFTLYDTFGFPLDLTALLCREKGLALDTAAFDTQMEKQRQKAREGAKFKAGNLEINWTVRKPGITEFIGYETLESPVEILKYELAPENEVRLVLDPTPFYAESGGQVADQGILQGPDCVIAIHQVSKLGDDTVHFGKIIQGKFAPDAPFHAQVNREARLATQKNHTATHLLHKALQEVLGDHVQQSGSQVDPERLRFDFSHFQKVTAEELSQIEMLVNENIQRAVNLDISFMPIEAAKEKGAMALFGEKYGNVVRVVDIPGYSLELCGGTHVDNTGEIGVLKIISESSVASGIRRMEAITGLKASSLLSHSHDVVTSISSSLNISLEEVPLRFLEMQKELKKLRKNADSSSSISQKVKLEPAFEIKGSKVYHHIAEGVSNPNILKEMNDDIKSQETDFISLLFSSQGDKISYVAGSGSATQKKLSARDLAALINSLLDGKGGGRPDMTQGNVAAINVDLLEKLLEKVKEKL